MIDHLNVRSSTIFNAPEHIFADSSICPSDGCLGEMIFQGLIAL